LPNTDSGRWTAKQPNYIARRPAAEARLTSAHFSLVLCPLPFQRERKGERNEERERGSWEGKCRRPERHFSK
jgi:hypothetical protein